jgi:hypothetical protein
MSSALHRARGWIAFALLFIGLIGLLTLIERRGVGWKQQLLARGVEPRLAAGILLFGIEVALLVLFAGFLRVATLGLPRKRVSLKLYGFCLATGAALICWYIVGPLLFATWSGTARIIGMIAGTLLVAWVAERVGVRLGLPVGRSSERKAPAA